MKEPAKKTKSKTKGNNAHWGSTLDDFLEEDGTREAFQAVAMKERLESRRHRRKRRNRQAVK